MVKAYFSPYFFSFTCSSHWFIHLYLSFSRSHLFLFASVQIVCDYWFWLLRTVFYSLRLFPPQFLLTIPCWYSHVGSLYSNIWFSYRDLFQNTTFFCSVWGCSILFFLVGISGLVHWWLSSNLTSEWKKSVFWMTSTWKIEVGILCGVNEVNVVELVL